MPDSPRNPLIERFASGQMPLPARLAAARGALPIAREELLEILFLIRDDPEAEVRQSLLQTIKTTPDRVICTALEKKEIEPAMLEWFAGVCATRDKVLETIVLNSATSDDTVAGLAETAPPGLQDIIALNQVRLQRAPQILDALQRNPKLLLATKRRLKEIQELFAREAPAAPAPPPAPPEAAEEEAAPAPAGGVPEVSELPGLPGKEAEGAAPAAEVPGEDLEGVDLEGIELGEAAEEIVEEAVQEELDTGKPGIDKLFQLSVPEKLEMAMRGTMEERSALIRDASKLVCEAVLKSPRLSESEVERFAANRLLSEDILRDIAANREWMKNYAILHTLCKNPKMPTGLTMRLAPRLITKDLVFLSKNKNVAQAVRSLAAKIVKERTQRKPAPKKGGH